MPETVAPMISRLFVIMWPNLVTVSNISDAGNLRQGHAAILIKAERAFQPSKTLGERDLLFVVDILVTKHQDRVVMERITNRVKTLVVNGCRRSTPAASPAKPEPGFNARTAKAMRASSGLILVQ